MYYVQGGGKNEPSSEKHPNEVWTNNGAITQSAK